jgi:hypothetical protein
VEEMFELDAWKRVLFEPDAVFAEQKPKASLTNALVWTVLLGAIYFGISWFTVSMSSAIVVFISWTVGSAIVFLISNGVNLLFAKLLGGNGSFTEQAYLSALIGVPLSMMLILLNILMMALKGNFIVSMVMSLVFLAIMLYSIYLIVKVIMFVHNLSNLRAIAAIGLPVIILIIIIISNSTIAASMYR